ncbi:nucleotidyltransferase domain-containing protein [Catenulispora subtropica]|uniref:Polymerase nucleotidyl transferase domain-containing protein n=1 Tax=Catenulispora subtropica TaxID=450798 RepID=A0ABP5DJC0_9ACTN
MQTPSPHRRFLDEVLPKIRQDERVAGVGLAGSLAGGNPDVYSDVDLVVAVDDEAFDAVLAERFALIGAWTELVAGFTGEHVGEPRLVITLVGPPLLHVDFKFVRVSDFAERGADPELLWDRDGRLAEALAACPPAPRDFDPQWVEDRYWIWVHYAATKLGRGELFEVIGFLGYVREVVLGPLAALRAGAVPRGLRHLEAVAPQEAVDLRATLCGHDRADAARAILACVDLYRRWTADAAVPIARRHRAEELAVRYLQDVVDQAPDPA